MPLPRYVRFLLHTALLLVVLSVTGHIHRHLCLDGKEPAVTVHFEVLAGHPDHASDQHDDVDNELQPDGLPGKAPELQMLAILLHYSPLLIAAARRPLAPETAATLALPSSPAPLLPPLRAPPHPLT